MYIRYKVLRILAYSSPILPNNLGWSNPANRTTKTHLNWPRVRLVTSLLHITSSNGDRSSARADIDPNLDVSSVFSRKRGGCRAASWPWFSSARNSYHVCIYIYIFPDVLFPSLAASIFRAAKNEENTEPRWIHGGVLGLREECAAQVGRGEYTRRALRIMGICGRQVAKLYREAGNKRANGSYVRREILWRRVCEGLGSARAV